MAAAAAAEGEKPRGARCTLPTPSTRAREHKRTCRANRPRVACVRAAATGCQGRAQRLQRCRGAAVGGAREDDQPVRRRQETGHGERASRAQEWARTNRPGRAASGSAGRGFEHALHAEEFEFLREFRFAAIFLFAAHHNNNPTTARTPLATEGFLQALPYPCFSFRCLARKVSRALRPSRTRVFSASVGPPSSYARLRHGAAVLGPQRDEQRRRRHARGGCGW